MRKTPWGLALLAFGLLLPTLGAAADPPSLLRDDCGIEVEGSARDSPALLRVDGNLLIHSDGQLPRVERVVAVAACPEVVVRAEGFLSRVSIRRNERSELRLERGDESVVYQRGNDSPATEIAPLLLRPREVAPDAVIEVRNELARRSREDQDVLQGRQEANYEELRERNAEDPYD